MSNNNSQFDSYGVIKRNAPSNVVEKCVEAVAREGFAIFDSGFSIEQIDTIASSYDDIFSQHQTKYGYNFLRQINEHNTVRLPLSYNFSEMFSVLSNPSLLAIIDHLINGQYIANQQNLVTNPPEEEYNQGAWHRDLPYQHFVSSSPLAINALYCVDDFTVDNGASFVLPGSHKHCEFPSNDNVLRNQTQIIAPAGSYLVIDCMTYHRGGKNITNKARRAINQVFTIPYIKQQISIPKALAEKVPAAFRKLLGYGLEEPESTEHYFKRRQGE